MYIYIYIYYEVTISSVHWIVAYIYIITQHFLIVQLLQHQLRRALSFKKSQDRYFHLRSYHNMSNGLVILFAYQPIDRVYILYTFMYYYVITTWQYISHCLLSSIC